MVGDRMAAGAEGGVWVGRPTRDVAVLTLDNPPVNVMTSAMLTTCRRALQTLSNDMAVRAIVLTGAGKAFCSGADLKGKGGEDLSGFTRLLGEVAASRVPVIAAINGPCVGGGLELALCCDLRIASTQARFIAAGVNVGLMASTWRLPRLIGPARAKAMLLTGSPFEAEQMERWGLVTAVHEPADLMPAALALAGRIASRAPLSVEAAKRTVDRALDLGPEEARAVQASETRLLAASRDHREALAAFRDKREPRFTRS